MNLESPKIILPDDNERVAQLRKKLAEYATRLNNAKRRIEKDNPTWHPKQIELTYKQFSEYSKLAVLSELLLEGAVDTYDFSLKLQKEGGFNLRNFNQACGVINDYCKTGGKYCHGGTGLK